MHADKIYEEFFGARWYQIKSAILQNLGKVYRYNRFCKEFAKLPIGSYSENGLLEEKDETGLLKHYYLDKASIIAALLLPIKTNDVVLDACAAPGGKSLILAEQLIPHKGTLILNEISANRRKRLKEVIKHYIPQTWQDQIKITAYNTTQIGYFQKNYYDKILLDVPCSSEAHIIRNGKWDTYSIRSKALSQKQYKMIVSAMNALKQNGILLYSTCALSPKENDFVIEKALRKQNELSLLPITPNEIPAYMHTMAEQTNYGLWFLPDTCGCGPLYVARMQRFSAKRRESLELN